jgi:hypothetical protein
MAPESFRTDRGTTLNLTDPIDLVEESRGALQSVRRALIELYDAVGSDPSLPQEVARRFELNRNLTWKLSRVIGAADPLAALSHLPGQAGIELAIEAFERAGAPSAAGESVRAAMSEFANVVKEHAGDREQLELTLESMGIFERDTAALSGRELAFRGNSSVWGVQAKTRLALNFVAPGRTPGTVDYVLVSGLIGLRRLRPSVQWRLARAQIHTDRGDYIEKGPGLEEIEKKNPGDLPLILREFCSPNMPELLSRPTGDGIEMCLPAGQVGNRAAFDCYFGYIYRGVPAIPAPDNKHGSAAAPITLPVESLVFDLIMHKAVTRQTPAAKLYGFPHGGPEGPDAQTPANELPLQERIVDLAGSPPAVANPAVPGLARLANTLYARMNWNPADFRGLRLQVKHPPMSSRLVMRWPLE